LQALAKALRISAESLYVRAGILDERTDRGRALEVDVTDAVLADPQLNDRQRAVLLDVYESFLGEQGASKAPSVTKPTKRPVPRRASSAIHQPNPAPEPSQAPTMTPKSPKKEKQS
jgi:hypothetical protein